ncbi:hypothetical protein GCM10011348_46200 [Marinobacterium nitratireducens]|uniref:Uncharacterized protein n=1 Tax=Marinobacterium nitratireducens TaxID=518897 RepID=A0A918DZ40_9GAMM|nr:hypothetical protein [Marinobacterium nitratireducens]GGO89142.1 hypothetical protein GCM10011348_46200 [Marinobacterium nitratireducens]
MKERASNIIHLDSQARKVHEGMRLLEQRATIEAMPSGSEIKGLKLAAWKADFREYAKRHGLMGD